MKLVIDIPEGIYNTAVKGGFIYSMDDSKVINAIANGKLLPKGHGRLIDADEIQFENREFDTYGDYSRAFDAIDYAETIVEADKEGSDSE